MPLNGRGLIRSAIAGGRDPKAILLSGYGRSVGSSLKSPRDVFVRLKGRRWSVRSVNTSTTPQQNSARSASRPWPRLADVVAINCHHRQNSARSAPSRPAYPQWSSTVICCAGHLYAPAPGREDSELPGANAQPSGQRRPLLPQASSGQALLRCPRTSRSPGPPRSHPCPDRSGRSCLRPQWYGHISAACSRARARCAREWVLRWRPEAADC
jgi:hypothetical protein